MQGRTEGSDWVEKYNHTGYSNENNQRLTGEVENRLRTIRETNNISVLIMSNFKIISLKSLSTTLWTLEKGSLFGYPWGWIFPK